MLWLRSPFEAVACTVKSLVAFGKGENHTVVKCDTTDAEKN